MLTASLTLLRSVALFNAELGYLDGLKRKNFLHTNERARKTEQSIFWAQRDPSHGLCAILRAKQQSATVYTTLSRKKQTKKKKNKITEKK